VSVARVDPERPEPSVIERAAELIRRGGLVAFPTETVYGLGGNALDPRAIARIFAAKERPAFNPLIAHCVDSDAAAALSAVWPPPARRLAEAFWPGPLTLVLPKARVVPAEMTAGLPTVALRVPAHPVARALLAAAGVPIAAPSANRFTEVSSTTAEHVLKRLAERVDLVLDAGPSPLGIESTVLDLSGPEPRLLRPGTLSVEEIARVLGREPANAKSIPGDSARPSPGMLDRHYAPRARLLLFPAGAAARLRDLAESSVRDGVRAGALLRSLPPLPALHAPLTLPDEPLAYARELYAALHRLDDAGCDVVLVEGVPEDARWAGVADRLRRAAHIP
jgi:L-threonylcarbamoyladenylate synthase